MSFQAIYESSLHHPVSMWVAGAVTLAWLAVHALRRGTRPLLVYAVVWQIAIALDAWLTGPWKPAIPALIAGSVPIAFVVLGDLRFLLVAVRGARPGWAPPLTGVVGLGLAFIVPVASLVARSLWPGNMRALFLTYEVMFALLAITVRFTVVPRIEDDAWRRFVRDLTHFEMAQYVAWASADVVILSGVDVGYGMRLVPNLMYYAAFVPFLWWRRPPEAQA